MNTDACGDPLEGSGASFGSPPPLGGSAKVGPGQALAQPCHCGGASTGPLLEGADISEALEVAASFAAATG